jgi:hypothetical protein
MNDYSALGAERGLLRDANEPAIRSSDGTKLILPIT